MEKSTFDKFLREDGQRDFVSELFSGRSVRFRIFAAFFRFIFQFGH